MPRKKPEDLEAEDKTFENESKPHAKVVVPASKEGVSKKVKQDLDAKLIHMAKAVDSWRIFPRIFITTYIILLYKCVIWFMSLDNPTLEQSGLISIVVGAGAAWFGLYTSSRK